MRILNSFLLLLAVAILWMVPYTQGIYDFRTDVREDTFTVTTSIGETTSNVTLQRPVFDDDEETISVISDSSADSPTITGYTAASRSLGLSGLSANISREITVFYDIDALNVYAAIDKLLDITPIIIILLLILIPVVGLIVIWKFHGA